MFTRQPVIEAASYFIAHVPSLVRLGSKPSRELAKNDALMSPFLKHLRSFEDALAYPPHQAFIGNLFPDELSSIPRPWFKAGLRDQSEIGPLGEIMSEEQFYGVLKCADEFDLLWLETGFSAKTQDVLNHHKLMDSKEVEEIGPGRSLREIQLQVSQGPHHALPLYTDKDRLVGCLIRGHDEDINLLPEFLLENMASKAVASMALRSLLERSTTVPRDVDYIIGCGEEAVGDRYNRVGGNLAKAIGEMSDCVNATGSDVKAFCSGPAHATLMAGGLVASGVFDRVAIVAGCSLAKLGMKYQGHLKHDMPIMEDVLCGIAFLVRENDGVSPVLQLTSLGMHTIGTGSSQKEIVESLALRPIRKLGVRMVDIDKYATELHNPELTEPMGSGDVPRTNYRMLATLAMFEGEIESDQVEEFVKEHGMPGFSPTQGHIASAVPFLGHAIERMKVGYMERALFMAKGSLFLGRMTHLSDGASFILTRNNGIPGH